MLAARAGDLTGDAATALARALGVQPLTARLLVRRGIADAEQGRRFLAPRLADLRPPQAMAGFARAVARIDGALTGGETIGVFGDYDVDGVTSCALIARFLLDAGARVVPRVARRDAGYGFGPADADAFADAGCALVITCDCGTSDVDGMARARARGVDAIIVDHHQVPERDPGAHALINPHQRGCGFPFKGLASAGVGFYLAAALRTRLRERGADAPDPRALLDLAAIGTIADLAPLTDENRILVAAGLRELGRGARPGLRALAALVGLDGTRPIDAVDVGYKLAPRLNAPGRLGDAAPALALLLATDELAAIDRARECDDLNARRRVLQDQVYAEALAQAEAAPDAPAVIVAGDGWPAGVVGIVAAKLADRYRRPSLAIALEGATGRGSARSAGALHLFEALAACRDHLVRFGGHAQAAGLTVERERLAAFTAAFQAEAARRAGGARRDPAPVEEEVGLGLLTPALGEEIARLAPFGVGNPEPRLAARAVVDRSRVVGERHLQLTLRDGPHTCDAIAFGLADRGRDMGAGARVRADFVPEMDTFRGVRRLRLRVQELKEERA